MVGGVLEVALPRKLFVCLRATPICVYGLALSRMLLTDLPSHACCPQPLRSVGGVLNSFAEEGFVCDS